NQTTENLTCYFLLTDEDANTMNASVRWYKNLTLNSTFEYNSTYANGTTVISIFASGNLTKGDVWMCSVSAYDGTEWGEWVNSSNLTIANSAPTVTLYSPASGNITTNRTPAFYWNGSDADGDNLTYDLNLTCYSSLGGGCSDDNRLISGISAQNSVLTDYLKYLKDNNYYYNWTVRAYDGTSYSSWASPPWKLEIQASLDVVLINETINFGVIAMDGTNDTTTNNPYPFSLRNDGNCFANVSINATQLWATVSSNSSYYQFKIANLSGEEGAFNWAGSITAWNQTPINGATVAIVALNFSDSKDSAEVDVLVTVPNQEPAGDRGSIVYFESSLGE
ncbi:MAG: hypothetical protein V1788_00815, partial [Nanoarchaeota archaeon]